MAQRDNEARGRVTDVRRAYTEALLAGDEITAEIAIREAMEAGLSPAHIDEEIIAPALWLVGELWERGEISVADEHLATEICSRVLALRREAHRVVREREHHRVLLATPAGERHEVALRMVSNLLRDAGYRTLMLGADVPHRALTVCARRHRPDVICLSVTMAEAGLELMSAVREMLLELPSTQFVIGGRGVDRRLRPSAGIEICDRFSEAVEAVDATIKHAKLN
ncbi:MAG TPA: B12-binding domain-containing protein [Solirubrobacteraceae bacterium]|nr:B12-binding domain-containing protein [Solirubrobacteraceae bacterium]